MPSSADPPADFAGSPDQVAPALMPKGIRTRSFASSRTILALILREMSTTYGRTPGGYLWALIEPLGAVIVLSIAFSLVMRTPALGSSFPLFYATGYIPFAIYQDVSLTVARSLTFSRPLLTYPSVTWVDAILARFLLNFLTSLMVAYLLLTGLLLYSDTRVVLEIGPILAAIAMAALLGLSVGTLNCAIGGLFPVWDTTWSIFTRPLFLASGVILLYDHMPPVLQDIIWYNPLIHITGEMRRGFFAMYSPQYISPLYVIGFSLVTLALGLVLLHRYHRDILSDR